MAGLRFPFMLSRNSVLTIAACINGETAIFSVSYNESLCLPLLHTSTASKTMIFTIYCKEALFSLLLHASTVLLRFLEYIIKNPGLAIDACSSSGETAIFGIYYLEALCSPLMYTAMARSSRCIPEVVFTRHY